MPTGDILQRLAILEYDAKTNLAKEDDKAEHVRAKTGDSPRFICRVKRISSGSLGVVF